MASTILSDNGVTSGSAGLKTTAASDGALALQTTTSGGTATTALTIDTSQNVGIGTSSPALPLDIVSTTAGPVRQTTYGVAPAYSSRRAGGTSGSPTAVTNTQTLVQLNGTGYGATGFSTDQARVSIWGLAAETWTDTAQGTYLQFNTTPIGTTARAPVMVIDSVGNVGIGTTSPNKISGTTVLSINTGTAANYAGLDISTADAVRTALYANNSASYLETRTSTPLVFGTNTTERMRVNAGAPILCLAGGSTTATGTGIAFPATQSASSDANTLDDYEEGTWTPDLRGSGTAGTVTYNTDGRVGRYTKIGNVCKFQMWIQWTNWTGSPSGGVQVAGLPFTSKNTTSNYTAVNVYMDTAYTLNANSLIQGYINQNVTYVFLGQYAVGGGNSLDLGFDTNSALMISGVYEVN
jgi:hypothetical protein